MEMSMAELRGLLVEAIGRAREESEHCQSVFARPYSSHDSMTKFFEARGRWHGLGQALEILDSCEAELSCVGSS
jgi:hypothetical protein